MSALNSSRIYGISYGNKSSSQTQDNTLALVPVTVFLPAAGEVHVYRDGKLLSIQNFSMGSYELDTSRLPFGIYNVDIQVVVNGRVVSSRTANINKTFARKSSVTGDLVANLRGQPRIQQDGLSSQLQHQLWYTEYVDSRDRRCNQPTLAFRRESENHALRF